MNGAPGGRRNAVEEQPEILRLPLVAQDDNAAGLATGGAL
jgi:hypothetical protein